MTIYAPTYCPGDPCDPCISIGVLEIIGGAYYLGVHNAVAFSIGAPPPPPGNQVPPGPSVGTVTCAISIKDSAGLIAPGPTISGPIFWQGAASGILDYLGLAPCPRTLIVTPPGFDIFGICAIFAIGGPFSPSYDCCLMPIRNGAEGAVDISPCP